MILLWRRFLCLFKYSQRYSNIFCAIQRRETLIRDSLCCIYCREGYIRAMKPGPEIHSAPLMNGAEIESTLWDLALIHSKNYVFKLCAMNDGAGTHLMSLMTAHFWQNNSNKKQKVFRVSSAIFPLNAKIEKKTNRPPPRLVSLNENLMTVICSLRTSAPGH
jgi:hypothetical protein